MAKITYVLIGLFTLFLAGCCPRCQPEELADFLLAEDTGEWIAFTNFSSRIFINNQSQQGTFLYSPLQTGFEELTANCTDGGNCGICCDLFRAGFAYTQFTSANQDVVIDINFKKDFRQFLPTDDPLTITDYLTITFNNSLTCELNDIPGVKLTESVTLNGTSFDNVLICQRSQSSGNPGPTDPKAFYFNAEDGIVGVELGNGTIWSLKK